MTTTLYAEPYDLCATGFFFECAEDYQAKVLALRNQHGEPVEEFEIQYIDGSAVDAALAEACGLHQGEIAAFFKKIEEWNEQAKQVIIIAVGDCGYAFDWNKTDPGAFDVDFFPGLTMRELAKQFIDDGLFGDIPERLQFYLDYDAIARDLAVEYAEITIAGQHLIYRCA